jgi:hypothetical protein
MGDPKLVAEVLAQEWEADCSNLLVKDADDDGIAAYFNRDDGDHERARQAALGHRALQLLSAGCPLADGTDAHDRCPWCTILRELRKGG